MLCCGRRKISLKTCCVLYALTLFLNVFLCGLLFLDAPQLEQAPPPCHCPAPPPTENVPTCPPTPTQKQRLKGASGEPYLLVVMVLSSLKGRERRDTIRQTWAEGHRDTTTNIMVKFALGTEGVTSEGMESIQVEEDTYHDLLLLPGLRESYSNLTLKVLTSFIALDTQFDFSFLLKCDDDTFLKLDAIASELRQRSDKRSLYWGFFDGRAHVKRRGKWAEKDWFLCDRYLPYALGGGYVLSRDLVRRIVSNSDGLLFYNSEDVSVGVWLSAYEAERRHDVRFNTEYQSRGCRNSYVVSHKQSVADMLSKHKLLQSEGMQCAKEFQTRPSYVYNWSTDPTKCCERRKDVQ